ncbi:MAG: zinc-dependent alcohol dehydrogenase family protein [Planctomycetota bacterium]
MKSLQFTAPGDPASVLQLTELPLPQPGPGQVRVRMLVSPVNPSDLMYVRGHYTVPPVCPAVPGFEGVGIVEASGGGWRGKLFTGRRVVVLNRAGGNWSHYTIVPDQQIVPVSSALSDEQAACFFVNPATAWVMTREVLRVPPGAWLLQTAAGSALGRMIIRLGKLCGFRTLNIVRRETQATELRQLGADAVLVCTSDSDTTELADRIRSITGSSGLRYAVDAVGGATGSAVVHSLGPGGRMLAYGTLSGQPLSFSPRTLMTVGSSVEGFWLGNFMQQRGLLFRLGLVRRLTRLIRSGILSTEIAGTWPLEHAATAIRAAEDSTVAGKCLLRLQNAE